jgi:hypothetical protein
VKAEVLPGAIEEVGWQAKVEGYGIGAVGLKICGLEEVADGDVPVGAEPAWRVVGFARGG